MLDHKENLHAGAVNLLTRCGGLSAGDSVLIVREPPGLGYYRECIVDGLTQAAASLGIRATVVQAPFTETATAPDEALVTAMRAADLTVFLARLGDQLRFQDLPGAIRAIVCYALDGIMLGSGFGRLDHAAMVQLRDRIDNAMGQARSITVTCPAGTDFTGHVAPIDAKPKDTNTIRFPLSVHSPVPAMNFSGRIAQRGFLVGTGSRFYQPYACALEDVLFVEIDGNRITGFSGSTSDVARARAHYRGIGERYGIDPYFVHSWHCGIHPGCAFRDPARDSFERWSGSAFGNPRLLHVHTCGAYAPGEISLNILDPTVTVDGIALWQAGRLVPEAIPGATEILDRHPELRAAYDAPAQDCGLGPAGALSFV